MRTQRIVLGLAIAIGGAGVIAPASAQEYRGTWEQQMACTPDVWRLCGDRVPDVSRIVACGLEGNDTINISVNVPAEFHGNAGADTLVSLAGADTLFGEAGNDVLTGGNGTDLLVGGDGNDNLSGGNGRDVLIGGAGADNLSGGAGEDIVIAGTTDYDTNNAALADIVTEWNAAIPLATRVAHLHAGVGLNATRLTAVTVHDDSTSIDTLSGGAGSDWFFARSLTGSKDKLTGRVKKGLLAEILDEI